MLGETRREWENYRKKKTRLMSYVAFVDNLNSSTRAGHEKLRADDDN